MPRPKKMKNRQRVSLFMDAQQKARLDRLAARLGRPWSELAREALDGLLSKHEKQLKEGGR
jgi:predicted DNA-binding protein